MQPLDIVIVGGGIAGLGVARLAARNGFSVVVIERGDLAGGTSSRSSHMLHGGLRYLEHGEFALVRESLEERGEVLRMAPGLARPCRFLVPLVRRGRVAPWKLRLGLSLYDWLAGPRALAPHHMVRAREALELESTLEPQGLLGAGLYSDVVMDDARLAIAVARDAAAHGASIHSYTEATGAHPGADGTIEIEARHRMSGARDTFVARAVVNATGPWTDDVRRRLLRGLHPGAPDPPPLLRPSRGTHLVLPPLTKDHALLFFARSDGRAVFALPLGGWTLVGTTEVEVPTPPDESHALPTPEEIRYLRDEIAHVVPGAAGAAVHAAFAGVRPLLRSEDDEVGDASREHEVLADGALFTLAGGKYTTFRVMARDTLKRIVQHLGDTRPLRDPAEPLPAPVATALAPESLGEHAATHEYALRLGDVMRRRSALWLEPDRGRVAAPAVARGMANALGWSEARIRDEVQAWDHALREEEARLARAIEPK